MTAVASGATSHFAYRSYLNQMNSSAALSQTSMHDLQVTVQTASNGQADFDGDVYLSLAGSYSAMDEVKLSGAELEQAQGLFSAGSAITFSIKAPEMGSLLSATVRMVG